MKQFFNVLYRRILYRIPLKWLLVLLVVFALGFASFSDAYFECDKSYISSQSMNNGQTWSQNLGNGFADVGGDIFCIVGTETSFSVSEQCDGNYDITVGVRESYCITAAESTSNLCFKSNGRGLVGWYWFDTSCLTQPYTSLVCQTKYNLIPIDSVDSEYCTTNNLCPSCPSCPSCGSGGISNVYINDILHVGASNIFMNIAEEIDWDYAYTQGGNNMNIDIVGYNVDYEKMQEQIDIQNFKPDSSDLSTIISEIIPLFVPGLCIILLLYFIFRFIKKIF